MPTLFNPIKNDQQDQNQAPAGNGSQPPAQPAAPTQPVSISGSTAASPDEANGQKTNKPTSSGRFQNLNAYLKANSGANVANRVNDTLSSKGNELQQNFANAKQNYDQSVDAARQRYDQGLVNQVGQDPTKFTQNQDNVAKFNQMQNATYQGPTQMDQDNVLRNQSQDFSDLAGQTGTEAGRYSLLRQIYNNPNSTYSQGQQNLDNLLLQSNPQQLAQLQNSKVLSGQIQNQLGNTINQSKVTAQNAAQEAQATQDQTRSALNNLILGANNSISDEVKNAITTGGKSTQDARTSLNQGNLTSDQALKLGLISKLGDKTTGPLFNLRLGDYITPGTQYNASDPNVIKQLASQVANKDDYAKMQALGSLAGNNASSDASQILAQFSNPAQANTFSNPYGYDASKLGTDLANVRDEYNNKYNPLNTQLGGSQHDLDVISGQINNYGQATKDYLNSLPEVIRNSMGIKNYNPNASNTDVYKQFGQQYYQSPRSEIGYNYNDTMNRYNTDNSQIASLQKTIDQLNKNYGAGNILNISDADKYQPVSVGPSPGQAQGQPAGPSAPERPAGGIGRLPDYHIPGVTDKPTELVVPNPGIDTPRAAMGGGLTNIISAPTQQGTVAPNLGRQISVSQPVAPAPVAAPVPFSGVLSKLGRRI